MVPSPVAEALRHATYVAAARVTRLERACDEVMAAASAAGIPALLLKGLALGALVYPSPMVRPMDDVDLLVAEGDRTKLTEILHSLGYRNDLRGEEDFYVPGMTYSIDLHTGLVNTTRIPARGALWPTTFNELWSRSQSCVLGGIPVRTLSPMDTILHVATHAVHHHGLAGTLWMVDLVACLQKWPHAFDLHPTISPPLQRSLWHCLEVLSAYGLDPIPEVRAALRPRWFFPGEAWILSARKAAEVPQEIRYALTLMCVPQWRNKAAFLRQVLFPRAGVHTDGFGDARGTRPGWGQHWRIVMRLGRKGSKAFFAGQPRFKQEEVLVDDILDYREKSLLR